MQPATLLMPKTLGSNGTESTFSAHGTLIFLRVSSRALCGLWILRALLRSQTPTLEMHLSQHLKRQASEAVIATNCRNSSASPKKERQSFSEAPAKHLIVKLMYCRGDPHIVCMEEKKKTAEKHFSE